MDSKRALFLALTLMLFSALADVAQAARLLRTGQKKCWSTAGAVIPCTSTGQDGELRNGEKRAYMDNGNGTITDEGTGLVWEKLDAAGGIHDRYNGYSWKKAFARVAALNTPPCFAGHCDWRLPSLSELQSIIDYGRVGPSVAPVFQTPCTPGCSLVSCSCTYLDTYWTSSTYLGYPDQAWILDFARGANGGGSKTGVQHARAVRGRGRA